MRAICSRQGNATQEEFLAVRVSRQILLDTMMSIFNSGFYRGLHCSSHHQKSLCRSYQVKNVMGECCIEESMEQAPQCMGSANRGREQFSHWK